MLGLCIGNASGNGGATNQFVITVSRSIGLDLYAIRDSCARPSQLTNSRGVLQGNRGKFESGNFELAGKQFQDSRALRLLFTHGARLH